MGGRPNLVYSPGPGLWSLVLGPFGPDLGPDLDLTWDLTWDLDLDLSLTIFNADAWTSGCTDKHFFTTLVIIKNWFHPASINTVFGLSVKLSFFGHYFGQETFYACERTQTSFNTFHFLHQACSAVTHHPTPLIRLVTKFNKTLIGSI